MKTENADEDFRCQRSELNIVYNRGSPVLLYVVIVPGSLRARQRRRTLGAVRVALVLGNENEPGGWLTQEHLRDPTPILNRVRRQQTLEVGPPPVRHRPQMHLLRHTRLQQTHRDVPVRVTHPLHQEPARGLNTARVRAPVL